MTAVDSVDLTPLGISIHTLRVEGDTAVQVLQLGRGISIHTLRVEGDDCGAAGDYAATISIHTLRVEGDMMRRLVS